jgi:hypothetical protein
MLDYQTTLWVVFFASLIMGLTMKMVYRLFMSLYRSKGDVMR